MSTGTISSEVKEASVSGIAAQSLQEITPPPDIYADIRPCSHIKSVINSKSKNEVLEVYRQGVEISQAVRDNRTYYLKKDGSEISHSKLLRLKSRALECTDCSLNNFNHNFICLQCPHVGCFTAHNHALKHCKESKHMFAIDSSNGLLFCFLCGDYINEPHLETVRLEVLSNSKKNKDEKESYHQNYVSPSAYAVTGLRGFVNLGSTCFMSSILQTLIHNPFVKYHFFGNDHHYFNCPSNYKYNCNGSINADNACITCSIDLIFKNLFTSDNTDGVGMTNLLLTSWYKRKAFSGSQEQDAHEFWQFLLNEFHSDYEKITKIDANDTCKCLTHTVFSGELESSIKCAHCNQAKLTIDPMIDLSLEVGTLENKTIDLYDCLDLFTKEERLDSMYECQFCSKKTKALKSLKLKTVPYVLAFQLKRFKHNLSNDTFTKIDLHVEIPLYLNLKNYTSTPTSSGTDTSVDVIYELFALVCHMGSVNTGHYIVFVKDGNGQWFRFDDSVITRVSQEDVKNANPYLLYYIVHRI